ncbi:hypothetical protein [Shewanella sp. ZOR0012]|uniref:hypothetical protein n=1 Tax=Shewanella sp. ZOR0012 TaxID=1339231 RepID=UPI000646AF1E|nr:hypothetical protein [Shewanella sp. ZOR0012]
MAIGISELLSGLQFAEKIAHYVKKFLKQPEPETPASRFLALFNAHGVKASQIPDFFGHCLSIADCHSAESLTKVLTSDLMEKAAQLFGINRDWLDCASDVVYEPHSFYKNPQGFDAYLKSIALESHLPLRATLYMPTSNSLFYPDDSGVLVISVPVGEVNQRTIYCFELVNYDRICYWHCRGYLAANLASMLRRYAIVYGSYVAAKVLEPVAQGQRLPVYDYGSQDAFRLKVKGRVSIEELISNPDKYLEGVDPETNKFGHREAIGLWLNMADQMRTRSHAEHSRIVLKFEEAFKSLT